MMADNPFAKKFAKKSDHDGDEGEKGAKPGRGTDRPMGKGAAAKGNPFAKKMDGKHKPPPRRGKKRPARKGKLQKFGARY